MDHKGNVADWLTYQQELEDAFWLECDEEMIKTNEEANKMFKYLNKQRKYTKRMNKLANKILNGGDNYAKVFRMF